MKQHFAHTLLNILSVQDPIQRTITMHLKTGLFKDKKQDQKADQSRSGTNLFIAKGSLNPDIQR